MSEEDSNYDNSRPEHPVFGPCTEGHRLRNIDCDCPCRTCRRATRDRAAVFQAGDLNGPGRHRYHHPRPEGPPPPLPREYRNVRALPEIQLAELSRITGGFSRASSEEGSEKRLETSDNKPKYKQEYKELTLGLGSKPCTERIPWRVKSDDWEKPCPNDRRGTKLTKKKIRKCVRKLAGCYNIRKGAEEDDRYSYRAEERNRSYVCEDHRKDSKIFFRVDNLLRAHLVGTCKDCRTRLMRKYPNGVNTCTCPNLFERWLCRSCTGFEVKCLQTQFRRRVIHRPRDPQYGAPGGNADHYMLKDKRYHVYWKDVRRMLAELHPCSHSCGKKRVLKNEDAMDCRACGGKIVKAHRQTRRENQEDLLQLDFSSGNARRGEAQVVRMAADAVSEPSDSGEDDWDGAFYSDESREAYSEPGEPRKEKHEPWNGRIPETPPPDSDE